MKRSIIFLAAALLCIAAYAEDGRWKVYPAYHDATKTTVFDNRIFVLSDGGLYSYDPEDTYVETYDKAVSLSDNGIFNILLCEPTNELVIVYTNGNIDIMDAEGGVYNMPDLKNKIFNDRTINDVCVIGGTVYVSMNAGIVKVNVPDRVFGDFYDLGYNVRSVTIDGEYLIAATNNGVYRGNMTENLLDKSLWKWLRSYVINKLVNFNDKIYALTSSGTYLVADKENFIISRISATPHSRWSVCNNTLFVSNADDLSAIYPDGTLQSYGNQSINALAYSGGTYWAACGTDGLKGLKFSDGTFGETVSSVIPNSPIRNHSYSLVMAPGNRLLVAGGEFNYPNTFIPGTAMRYEGGTWSSFDEEGPLALVGANAYMNVTDIVQDPRDSEHHFVGTMRSGIYEFRDFKLANHYSLDNSQLTTILPNSQNKHLYVRATALAYDPDNNLWMCNNECDTIIRIRRDNGTWTSLYVNEIKGYPTFDHTVFDRNGQAWINSRRSTSTHRAGFLVVNPNGTFGDTKDDTFRFFASFSNQDGTSYSPTYCYCMTEDLEGAMWFGTSSGPFVSYNTANAFSPTFYFTQIKVPRNDGTNLADYLMADVPVSCITVDGGNRKWMGTAGNGVYLVSADGLEIIHHFTTDNSPLISDDIYSIAIDGSTGEVFFGTAKGLVSFLSDATDPEESFNKSLVKIYPNPVRPDYNGNISVTGLMYNSNVKIVNAAGRLVNEGTSVGGEYTWNGRLANGKRAGSGIYYVLATDEEGSSGVASKFLIVK